MTHPNVLARLASLAPNGALRLTIDIGGRSPAILEGTIDQRLSVTDGPSVILLAIRQRRGGDVLIPWARIASIEPASDTGRATARGDDAPPHGIPRPDPLAETREQLARDAVRDRAGGFRPD